MATFQAVCVTLHQSRTVQTFQKHLCHVLVLYFSVDFLTVALCLSNMYKFLNSYKTTQASLVTDSERCRLSSLQCCFSYWFSILVLVLVVFIHETSFSFSFSYFASQKEVLVLVLVVHFRFSFSFDYSYFQENKNILHLKQVFCIY